MIVKQEKKKKKIQGAHIQKWQVKQIYSKESKTDSTLFIIEYYTNYCLSPSHIIQLFTHITSQITPIQLPDRDGEEIKIHTHTKQTNNWILLHRTKKAKQAKEKKKHQKHKKRIG